MNLRDIIRSRSEGDAQSSFAIIRVGASGIGVHSGGFFIIILGHAEEKKGIKIKTSYLGIGKTRKWIQGCKEQKGVWWELQQFQIK